jgi:hypothetical protein
MSVVAVHNLHIYSVNRSAGTSTDCTFAFSNPIKKKRQDTFFTVTVDTTCCPFSFNQINNSNNVVSVSYAQTGAATQTVDVTIPAGNYTILALLLAFSETLTADSPFAIICNFTHSSSTGLASFSLSSSAASKTTSLTIHFENNLILGKMCGFTGDAVFGFSNVGVPVSCTSQQKVNTNPVQNIYIRSTNLTQTDSREWIVEPDVISDIIGVLSVEVPPNSWIKASGNVIETRITNSAIDCLKVYLSDDLTYSLDLQNLDWNFRMTVREILDNAPPESITSFTGSLPYGEDDLQDEHIKKLMALKEQLEQQIKEVVTNK